MLIDWNPRHLYRKLFASDEAAMEAFLATVCTHDWNRCQDAGRSFAEGARLLKALHPDKAALIDAYGERFDEMMPGPIAGSVEILSDLQQRGVPLYGLTNFSAETYPPTALFTMSNIRCLSMPHLEMRSDLSARSSAQP